MELGFVGLGKMGLNMVKRLLAGGHHVAAYDRDAGAIGQAEAAGASGASSLDELVSALAPPRVVWVMVPSGDPTESTIAALSTLLSGGRHHRRRRQHQLSGRCAARRRARVEAHPLRRCRDERRDLGSHRGLLPHGRRQGRGVPDARAGVSHAGAGARLPARRRSRRRSLREDDPQRDRVRVDAGICGRVSSDARGRLQDRRRRGRGALDAWQRGPIVAAGTDGARPGRKPESGRPQGLRRGFGRGTVDDAGSAASAVPVPVLAAALFTRFRSREDNPFAERLLAALRHQFGGHAVRRDD